MARFNVQLEDANGVLTSLAVEADDYGQAADLAYEQYETGMTIVDIEEEEED